MAAVQPERSAAARMTRLAAALAGAALFASCASPQPAAPAVSVAPALPPPPPRDAVEIANATVGARLGALVHVDRVRTHPIAPKLATLESVRSALEGTGIDPQRDLHRVYVAAPSTRAEADTVVVVEHAIEPARLQTALEALVRRSAPEGTFVNAGGVPAARFTVRGYVRVAAPVTPAVVVVLPEHRAADAARFVGTGGLAEPAGAEAISAFAESPAETLRVPNVPPIPPTVRAARALVTLGSGGAALIEVDGASTDANQAVRDAEALTRAVDDATSLRVAVVKVRLFPPVVFRPEGDHVLASLALGAADLERLYGLASAMDAAWGRAR